MEMAEGSAVRCHEQEIGGGTVLALENGESRLLIDPAQGGRWTTWDLALPGAERARLMSAPGARITAGAATITAVGQTPEVTAGLGPAAPSGLGDHFLPLSATQRDFAHGHARELGTFTAASFAAEHYSPARDQQEVALRCEGGIRGAKRVTPVTLLKRLTLGRPGAEISIHYRLDNPTERALQILFGVEFCFALGEAAAGGGAGAYEFDGARERGGFGVSGIATNVTTVALVDPHPGVTLRLGWDRAASVWISPYPAGGALRGASALAVWDLRLPPDDNWACNLWLQAGPTGPVAPIPPDVVARIARAESEDEPWK